MDLTCVMTFSVMHNPQLKLRGQESAVTEANYKLMSGFLRDGAGKSNPALTRTFASGNLVNWSVYATCWQVSKKVLSERELPLANQNAITKNFVT